MQLRTSKFGYQTRMKKFYFTKNWIVGLHIFQFKNVYNWYLWSVFMFPTKNNANPFYSTGFCIKYFVVPVHNYKVSSVSCAYFYWHFVYVMLFNWNNLYTVYLLSLRFPMAIYEFDVTLFYKQFITNFLKPIVNTNMWYHNFKMFYYTFSDTIDYFSRNIFIVQTAILLTRTFCQQKVEVLRPKVGGNLLDWLQWNIATMLNPILHASC